MATNDQLLISDHKKVLDIVKLYKNINLISTSGEPTDEYDIEYRVRGFSNTTNGKIEVTKQHRVKIILPFGYPHFPPTVKPLGPIFHPDVDDNVVRIADYWEENKSFADLILHLGEMICGKVCNDDSPFNRKAAEYYKKHEKSLPLDSLRLAAEDVKKGNDRAPVEFNFPIFKVLFSLVLIALICAGGLFFIERSKLARLKEIFQQALIYEEYQEYTKAQATAKSVLKELENIHLLNSSGNSLQKNIHLFLQSQSLQEGLKGKIKFEGKYIDIETAHKLELFNTIVNKANKVADSGNRDDAIYEYEKAVDYANRHQLTTQISKIRKILAEMKLEKLLSSSETAHKNKDWEWAIKEHKKVLSFIEKEREFLNNGAQKQGARTQNLLLLDQIAFYTQKASQAEAKQDLAVALQNYNALINFIGKSGSQSDSTLKKTLVESMQRAAIITEKINIANKREWLMATYKDIFPNHYPSAIATALSSPQAAFIRYEGKKLIFDLTCLEKGQGSVVRLRVYYMYDPDTQQWSIYTGEI